MIQHTSGIHDVDERSYHGDRRSLSVSGAKVLLDCPARYKWQQDNPVHKDAYDFGHVAHELILGKGARYRVLDFDSWRSKDAREAKDQAHADGVAPILTAEHERALALADAVKAHPDACKLLYRGQAESSLYAIHEATGVVLRGRADWITQRVDETPVIVDVKTAASAAPDAVDMSMVKFRYGMQVAWYIDLLAANGKPGADFYLIYAEKAEPHLVSVAEVLNDSEVVEWGRAMNEKAIRLYAECVENDYWPGYRVYRPGIKPWAWDEAKE